MNRQESTTKRSSPTFLGKRPNYPDNCDEMSESDEDQNRDDEPSESDEETICVDVLEEAEQDGTAEEDGTVELTPEMSTVSSVNLMPVHDDNRESRSPVNFEDDCDSCEWSSPQNLCLFLAEGSLSKTVLRNQLMV